MGLVLNGSATMRKKSTEMGIYQLPRNYFLV